MCGIFGFIGSITDQNVHVWKKLGDHLFTLSESRGSEASGFASINKESLIVYKNALRASKLITSVPYQSIWKKNKSYPLGILGHTRLVTNGKQWANDNNQPVVKDGIVCIHNGIVVNDTELWQTHPSLKKNYD